MHCFVFIASMLQLLAFSSSFSFRRSLYDISSRESFHILVEFCAFIYFRVKLWCFFAFCVVRVFLDCFTCFVDPLFRCSHAAATNNECDSHLPIVQTQCRIRRKF